MITSNLLRKINPKLTEARAAEIARGLSAAASGAGINTPARVAAFLAQLAHESVGFQYVEEIWGPTPQQRKYDPASGSQLSRNLGNTQPGDGRRYAGKGWIQLTGRHNFRKFGKMLNLDLEGNPDLAARPDVAARLAAAYWTSRGLNALADAGNFREITRRINGGYNGLADRERYHRLIKEAIDMPSKVFLKDASGKNIEWDDKEAVYAGVKLRRYPDGAIQLERVEPAAKAEDIPALPPKK